MDCFVQGKEVKEEGPRHKWRSLLNRKFLWQTAWAHLRTKERKRRRRKRRGRSRE